MGYVYVTIPICKGPYLPHEGGYGGYFYSDKVNLQYDAVGTVGHIKLFQKGGFKLQSGNIPKLMTNTYDVNGSNVNDPEQCWENGYQLPDIVGKNTFNQQTVEVNKDLPFTFSDNSPATSPKRKFEEVTSSLYFGFTTLSIYIYIYMYICYILLIYVYMNY